MHSSNYLVMKSQCTHGSELLRNFLFFDIGVCRGYIRHGGGVKSERNENTGKSAEDQNPSHGEILEYVEGSVNCVVVY